MPTASDGGACFPAGYAGREPGSRGRPRCTRCRPYRSSDSSRRQVGPRASPSSPRTGVEHDGSGTSTAGRALRQRPDRRDGHLLRRRRHRHRRSAVGERLDDRRWNCKAENGSVRSSFPSTIDVVDGLLEFEQVTGVLVAASLLQRRGVPARARPSRKSTGEIVDPAYLDFAFPVPRATTCCGPSTTSDAHVPTR